MHGSSPSGALNAKLAMEASTTLAGAARPLEVGTYGPVGDAAAKGTPEQRKVLVTAPENIKDMLILNEEQAALYSAKYENEWNRMQLGDRRRHGVLARRAAVSRRSSAPAASLSSGRSGCGRNAPGNDMMRMIRRGGFAGLASTR